MLSEHEHTPHTPTDSRPLPRLAHWNDIEVSELGSRVGKERTNKRIHPRRKTTSVFIRSVIHSLIITMIHDVTQWRSYVPLNTQSTSLQKRSSEPITRHGTDKPKPNTTGVMHQ